MTDSDWELINAFADEELDGEGRAQFESRLENEPALREALATVLFLKAGVRAVHDPEALGACIPPSERELFQTTDRVKEAGVSSKGWRGRIRFAVPVAAGLALIVAAGAAYTVLLPASGSWESRAITVHDAMSETPYAIQENSSAEFVSSAGYQEMPVPDLRASSLYYAGMDSASDYLALHYRGRNGCSLTVLALNEPEPDHEDASASIAAENLFRSWRDEEYRYVVIAQGMDRSRFEAIAAFVESDIRRKRDMNEQLRIAMAEAYRQSVPCA